MSEQDPIVATIETDTDTPVTEFPFSKEEANYFLHVLDFHRSTIKGLLENTPPFDLVTIMAFLQGAIEAQIPEAQGAFDGQRGFFRTIYPMLLQSHLQTHPEEAVGEDNLLIVVPSPAPNIPGVCDLPDGPRIVTTGSSKVQ